MELGSGTTFKPSDLLQLSSFPISCEPPAYLINTGEDRYRISAPLPASPTIPLTNTTKDRYYISQPLSLALLTPVHLINT